MYNFFTNFATALNFTVPEPSSVCFWVILRGYNVSLNNFLGTAINWRARFDVPTTKVQAWFNQSAGLSSTSNLGVGSRVHLAFTMVRSTSGRLYFNAVEEGNNAGGDTPTSPNTLLLGSRNGSTECANADMEDIRIYDRVLSAGEIKDIYYANGRDNIVSGLLNRWGAVSPGNGQDMDGTTLYDIAGRLSATVSGSGAFYRGGFLNPRRRV